MGAHSLKEIREQFQEVGKFHTPRELALLLRGLIPGSPARVYDPTCGSGSLLEVFPEETQKYGQDIDAAALEDAQRLPNFHGHLGDVFTDPAWLGEKFEAIVANPPFSVKWQPQVDERFFSAPVLPTASRADFAFLLHILFMLADSGTAAVMCSPGVLYRGAREGKLRQWLVEENVIDRVVHIPGNKFADTTIATCVLVLRKNRAPDAPIMFVDTEHDLERLVPLVEVRENEYLLSVSRYVEPPMPEREPFDAWAVEQAARREFVGQTRGQLAFSRQVAEFEGWPLTPFIDELAGVLDEFRGAA